MRSNKRNVVGIERVAREATDDEEEFSFDVGRYELPEGMTIGEAHELVSAHAEELHATNGHEELVVALAALGIRKIVGYQDLQWLQLPIRRDSPA